MDISIVAQWALFTTRPVATNRRLLLAKAKQPGAPVYDCSYGPPRSWEWGPPDAGAEPQTVMTGEDLVVAESLDTPGVVADRWARVTAVQCLDIPDSDARLLVWNGGVQWSDLRPATLDEIQVPKAEGQQGLVVLWPPIPRVFRYFAAQYPGKSGSVVAVTSGQLCTLYHIESHDGMKVLVATEFHAPLMIIPGLRVWPRSAKAPDVLAYDPPAGLVCWRLRGDLLRPALLTSAQLGFMLYMLARGWFIWLVPVGCLGALYLAGLRPYIIARRAHHTFLLATALILSGISHMFCCCV